MNKCEKDKYSLSKRIAKNDNDIDNEAGWLTRKTLSIPYRHHSQSAGITHSDEKCNPLHN